MLPIPSRIDWAEDGKLNRRFMPLVIDGYCFYKCKTSKILLTYTSCVYNANLRAFVTRLQYFPLYPLHRRKLC